MKDNLFLVHRITFKLRSKLKHIVQYSLSCSFLKLEMLENSDSTIDGCINFAILQNFFSAIFKFLTFFFENLTFKSVERMYFCNLSKVFISSNFLKSILCLRFFKIYRNFRKLTATRIYPNIPNTLITYFCFIHNFFKQVFPWFY